jgi:hypothetical protein
MRGGSPSVYGWLAHAVMTLHLALVLLLVVGSAAAATGALVASDPRL